jgi:uncharacterized protein (TIGR03067 family)
MKTLCALSICVLVGVFVPLGAQDKTSSGFDAAKLIGKWDYVSGIKNGTKVAPEELKKQSVTITKDKITLKNEQTFVMKYDLDASKKPVGIKLEMIESPFGPGAKAAGIIDVAGDELRLCYSPVGEAAPKAFEAKEGSNVHLFVLKRAK